MTIWWLKCWCILISIHHDWARWIGLVSISIMKIVKMGVFAQRREKVHQADIQTLISPIRLTQQTATTPLPTGIYRSWQWLNPYSVDRKQSETPAMRAFFTFPPTWSTEGHGWSTSTLEAPVISARSNDEFPPKQEPRITAFNQSYHYQIAIRTPYS